MAVPHSIYRETGTVAINTVTCKNCGQCARICPTEVLRMEEGRLKVCADSSFGCIACGHCMMVCPEGSVSVTGRGLAPGDLMPLPGKEQCAKAEELEALMLSRRSVRRFSGRDIEPEVLERILRLAASAPMGIPPWDVGCVVVSGRTEVRQLADAVVEGYGSLLKYMKPWLLAVLRPFIGRKNYEFFGQFVIPLAKGYLQAQGEGKDALFYDAAAVLLFHHSPVAEAADAMIACTYAMLAAEAMGIGNTMIGAAAPIIQRNQGLCRRLKIPPGNKPAIALILGYPAAVFRKAIRRQFTAVTKV